VLQLKPTKERISGHLNLSGSKSISNRALIIKHLSNSKAEITNLSKSEDTVRLNYYLNFIDTCIKSNVPMIIDSKNAGTIMRFLTAYLSLCDGRWLLTGSKRMQERPIKDLVLPLKNLGADIKYTNNTAYPPLLINGKTISGGKTKANPEKSSQFISALMMIAPYLAGGLQIELSKLAVSASYIKMTKKIMDHFGISSKLGKKLINIEEGEYIHKDLDIEPDWSSASYWYEVAALTNDSNIFIPGLLEKSFQGDSKLAEIYKNLGVETFYREDGVLIKSSKKHKKKLEYNFSSCPDLVPSVMACCAAKNIKLILNGIEHLRYKESDRIKSMSEELSKLGCEITKDGESYILKPMINVKKVVFNTHHDHRLAMCLAPLCLAIEDVSIINPEVVEKSYPDFWKDMISLKVFTTFEKKEM